jgi:hypothetical protein
MANEDRVTYEVSVGEPEAGRPARLYVWVRRFQGDEELTGRYEIFESLARLDEFIARVAAAGGDTAGLRNARESFAASLARGPETAAS